MKVRFLRTYLHHSTGDVEQFDVEKAKRLISLGAAVLHVETDFIAPPDPVEDEMKENVIATEKTKEAIPPNDKMIRSSATKAPNKKTKKRGRPRKA